MDGLTAEQKTLYYRLMAVVNRKGYVRSDMSPCWISLNTLSSAGYGQICINGKRYNLHRLSWWLHNGCPSEDTMEKMHVSHKCDNKDCCNPEHLYLGTAKENAKDVWDRGLKVKKEPKAKLRNAEPCLNCVLNHKKCDGGSPCSFCATSGADCIKKEYRTHAGTFTSANTSGENNGRSKLKDEQILLLRKKYTEGFAYGELKKYASELGVAYITVQKLCEKNPDGSWKKRPELTF